LDGVLLGACLDSSEEEQEEEKGDKIDREEDNGDDDIPGLEPRPSEAASSAEQADGARRDSPGSVEHHAQQHSSGSWHPAQSPLELRQAKLRRSRKEEVDQLVNGKRFSFMQKPEEKERGWDRGAMSGDEAGDGGNRIEWDRKGYSLRTKQDVGPTGKDVEEGGTGKDVEEGVHRRRSRKHHRYKAQTCIKGARVMGHRHCHSRLKDGNIYQMLLGKGPQQQRTVTPARKAVDKLAAAQTSKETVDAAEIKPAAPPAPARKHERSTSHGAPTLPQPPEGWEDLSGAIGERPAAAETVTPAAAAADEDAGRTAKEMIQLGSEDLVQKQQVRREAYRTLVFVVQLKRHRQRELQQMQHTQTCLTCRRGRRSRRWVERRATTETATQLSSLWARVFLVSEQFDSFVVEDSDLNTHSISTSARSFVVDTEVQKSEQESESQIYAFLHEQTQQGIQQNGVKSKRALITLSTRRPT
jgi:hypothetical protein